VIKPTAAAWMTKDSEVGGYEAARVGCGMIITNLTLQPTDVCFGNLDVRERNNTGDGIFGLCAADLGVFSSGIDPQPSTYHEASGVWIPITDTNVSDSTGGAGRDRPALMPPGLPLQFRQIDPRGNERIIAWSDFPSGSGFDWNIPYEYRAKDGTPVNAVVFTHIRQTFRFAANGALSITKDSSDPCTVSRTPSP
jgi:hypothetical protein